MSPSMARLLERLERTGLNRLSAVSAHSRCPLILLEWRCYKWDSRCKLTCLQCHRSGRLPDMYHYGASGRVLWAHDLR